MDEEVRGARQYIDNTYYYTATVTPVPTLCKTTIINVLTYYCMRSKKRYTATDATIEHNYVKPNKPRRNHENAP